MYTLRQINKEGVEANLFLGVRYSTVYRDRHKKRFEHLLGVSNTHPDQDKVYAFILYDNGTTERSYPLYVGQTYYIMTDSGKTFDNLTSRYDYAMWYNKRLFFK